jgi:hypothetical protein
MCSDLIQARWTDAFGGQQQAVVNLEEIWPEGAVLQFEFPVRPGVRIEIDLGSARVAATVEECHADFVGHFAEISFTGDFRWSRELYEPDHLFDPQSLVKEEAPLKDKNTRLLEEVLKILPRRVA